jgi:hypothetical protein
MDDAPQHTPAQAADPSTPAEVLAEIAGSRPDLHPYLAANPATYPALLEWLGKLGDPDVDAALEARAQAAAAPLADGQGRAAGEPAPPQEAAPGSGATPARDEELGSTPERAGGLAEGATPAGGDDAYVPPAATQPWSDVSASADWNAPGAGGAGAPAYPPQVPAGSPAGPQAQAPYGAPGAGYPYPPGIPGDGHDGPPPGAPYGPPLPGGAYGAAPRPRGSRAWLWVLLGVLGLLLVGGTVVGILVVRAITDAADGMGSVFDTGEASSYGDDPELDALWDGCAGGDMAACDELYRQSPSDSEYEEFADTCGGRTEGGTWCEDTEVGGTAAPSSGEDGSLVASPAWGRTGVPGTFAAATRE